MTDEELIGIDEVISRAQQSSGMAAGHDVAMTHAPALLAEVRSLRAERDALRKERDILAARLEAAIELEAEVSGANRRLVRERDTMRTVCEAAAVYCGNRTVANEHALIDAAGAVKFLTVQP